MTDIKKIQKCVEGSLAVENAKPSKEGKKITEKYLKGEITSSEAIKKIKKRWGVK